MAERDWAEQVQQILEQAAKPAQARLEAIQNDLDENEEEHRLLIEERREVKATLNRLVPSKTEKREKKVTTRRPGVPPTSAEKAELVRQWLLTHQGKYADGFTGAGVHRDMVAGNGKGLISPSVVVNVLKDFHEVGFIRADKKVKGGAMQYKLVSP